MDIELFFHCDSKNISDNGESYSNVSAEFYIIYLSMEVDCSLPASLSTYTLALSKTLAMVSYISLYPLWFPFNLFTFWKWWLFKNSSVASTSYEGTAVCLSQGQGTPVSSCPVVVAPGPCGLISSVWTLFSLLPYSLALRTTISGCVMCNLNIFQMSSLLYILKIMFENIYLFHGTNVFFEMTQLVRYKTRNFKSSESKFYFFPFHPTPLLANSSSFYAWYFKTTSYSPNIISGFNSFYINLLFLLPYTWWFILFKTRTNSETS